MKKFKIIFMTLVIALLVPFSAFASNDGPQLGPGSWDKILDDYFTATSAGSRTPIVYSGGGDVRVCVGGINYGNTVELHLYSDNGSGDSVDQFVFPVMRSSITSYACFDKVDARPYVDGSNGKAEFYVKMYSKVLSNDSIRVVIED